MWNDTAIVASNPGLASLLPAEPISIGYDDDDDDYEMTVLEVLKRSLESFSPDFKAALAAANRSLSDLPPARSGAMVPAGNSTSARLSWLSVCTPFTMHAAPQCRRSLHCVRA
jgi:hypothetical protein